METPIQRGNTDLGNLESGNEDVSTETAGSDPEERQRSTSPSWKRHLFTDDSNHPINFFIHNSVKKADTIQKLTMDITQHGGRVVQDVEHASIVLVHRNYNSVKDLQASYETAQHANLDQIFVEPTPFVMNCITHRQISLHEEEIKPMRGFPPGRRRNEYTPEEDEQLCYYLSRITPKTEAGGRSGHNIYKRLVRLGKINPEHFDWANSHPHESWRGRYKKNKARMDEVIERMVKDDPPAHKQLWREDRRLNKRGGVQYVDVSDEEQVSNPEEEEEEEEEEGDDDEVIVEKPRQSKRPQRTQSLKHREPPSKRSRVASGQKPSKPQKQKRAKGKERAVEEEYEDEEVVEMALYSLDIDGPDPSGKTLVSTHTQGPPPPSNFLTQETLVPSTPRNDNRAEMEDHGLPAPTAWPSPIQIPHIPHPAPVIVNTSTRSAPALMHSPSNGAQKQVDESGPAPSLPDQKRNSLPTPSTNPNYQRPRMAARRPKGFTRRPMVDNSEPSRNTRSRTQRPPVAPSPQTKEKPKEEIVNDSEDEQEPSVTSPGLNGVRAPSEDDNENRNVNQARQRDERASSMDTDDAETKQNLSAPSKASSSLGIDPSEILRLFQTQRSDALRGSSRPSLRPSTGLLLGTPRVTPQTPKRVPITPGRRPSNSSSVESFPLSGTKASAMKKHLQDQEKNTPYNPPEGTRAARLATTSRL